MAIKWQLFFVLGSWAGHMERTPGWSSLTYHRHFWNRASDLRSERDGAANGWSAGCGANGSLGAPERGLEDVLSACSVSSTACDFAYDYAVLTHISCCAADGRLQHHSPPTSADPDLRLHYCLNQPVSAHAVVSVSRELSLAQADVELDFASHCTETFENGYVIGGESHWGEAGHLFQDLVIPAIELIMSDQPRLDGGRTPLAGLDSATVFGSSLRYKALHFLKTVGWRLLHTIASKSAWYIEEQTSRFLHGSIDGKQNLESAASDSAVSVSGVCFRRLVVPRHRETGSKRRFAVSGNSRFCRPQRGRVRTCTPCSVAHSFRGSRTSA
jgi:hypothetical protein